MLGRVLFDEEDTNGYILGVRESIHPKKNILRESLDLIVLYGEGDKDQDRKLWLLGGRSEIKRTVIKSNTN